MARSEERWLYSQANAFTKQREVIKNHTYLLSFVDDYTVVLESNYTLLCHQVLEVRRNQLDEKMEENKRRQQESIESREELLRELEEVQRMTAREKAEEVRQRKEREEEIQEQARSQYY